MKILWLGLEHNLGQVEGHSIYRTNKDNWDFGRIMNFKPDLVIEREFNDAKSIYDIEIAEVKAKFPKCKSAVWLIDTHVSHDRHIQYSKNFDYVFLAISKYVDEFKKLNPNTYWLPLSFPLPELPDYEKKPEHAIGFVGRFNTPFLEDRTKFLKQIESKYNGLCHFVTDYNNVYQIMSNCRLIINKSFADDMNFRVFETLACKSVLVTNEVPDLYKIRRLQNGIFIYKDFKEATEYIDYILKNGITLDHSNYIKRFHMITNRIKSLLEMIKVGKQSLF